MPPMPETESPPVTAPPKRARGRRVLRWLGILLLVVVVFHRPLFLTGMRLLLVQVAAKQNLKLDVHFSGSIFTNLTVEHIHAVPTGHAPSPVRRIDIERVRLDYSIPLFFRNGVGEFLRSYEVANAELEIDALPSQSEPERQQKRSLAEDLNNLLGQPAAYADRVRIENFNIIVRAENNVTEVKGFHLYLDPEKTGYLRIARLQIPGVPLWENLAAETSYEKRNFFIHGLRLAPELVLDEVNFDASQRAKKIGGMSLKASVFGGKLTLSLAGSQLDKKGENLDKSYDTTLKITASGIGLESAAAYFGAPKPPAAKLANLSVLFTGEPEKPRTWRGNLGARIEALTFGPTKVDGVELAAQFDRGKADVQGVHIAAGKNQVGIVASVGLPESVNDFPLSEVDAKLQVDAPDLPALTGVLPDPISGRVTGGGPIKLSNGWVKTELAFDAATLASKGFAVDGAKLLVSAMKRISPAEGAPTDNLASHIVAEIAGLRVQDFTIDAARLDVENQNDLVTLHNFEVRRAENTVTARGMYRVPRDFKDAATAPIDAQFSLQVPKLEDFGIKMKDATLSGHLNGEGNLQLVNDVLGGKVQLQGGDFQLGDFKTGSLAVKVQIANNVASVEQLDLQLNATDQLAVNGAATVKAPFPYDVALLLDIKNLAALRPLLAVFGATQSVGGTLHVEWAGKGEAGKAAAGAASPAVEHSGQIAFALTQGHFDKIVLKEITLSGLYGPGFAQSTELKLVTGPTSFTGILEMNEGKVRLKDMNLMQGNLTVLTGYTILPINFSNPQQPIPLEERFAANINATNLDLDKLLGSFAQTSPVSGTINANLVAGGTLLQPFGHLKFNGRKLKSKAVAQLDAADLDLDLHYSNKDLTLAAVARQPQMQPLTIKGHVPLDLEATVKSAKLDPTLPLDVEVQLPPSSLAVVQKFAPQVRKIDGTLALDVRVAGSVEKPVLSGSAALDLANARLDNENVPSIRGLKARLGFANDTLSFNTFEGELGGGTFKLGGTIKLPKLTEPVFDLHLKSNEVLVKRDDSITVRADADISLAGPLASASVGGTVFITHSRFFKEIDILPIAMPGKAKPAPKSAKSMDTGVSFPAPPLRDWKFDLAIKTKPDDAFLIRGNLANGAAALDLKFAGTGLAPYLEGSIRIEEFKASLPFSTLSVSRGFVYFKKEAPFQPSLELQADSQTRDYLVHAYIYGQASDPQIQLSSEPPLPYSDIVSLLATGVTASQLTGSADVLASKAAMLAIQQLYRKTFLRGKAPAIDSQKKGDGDFLNRFQIELGALDNRTGGQQVISRVRLTDQLYLIGDLETGGGFTGSLKYLIRFR